MKKWVCLMGHEFDERPKNDVCPYDASFVKEVEVEEGEEEIVDERFKEMEEEKYQEYLRKLREFGEGSGLGILILGLNSSIGNLDNESYKKLEAVVDAFATAIVSLISDEDFSSESNDYSVSIFELSGIVKPLRIFKAR